MAEAYGAWLRIVPIELISRARHQGGGPVPRKPLCSTDARDRCPEIYSMLTSCCLAGRAAEELIARIGERHRDRGRSPRVAGTACCRRRPMESVTVRALRDFREPIEFRSFVGPLSLPRLILRLRMQRDFLPRQKTQQIHSVQIGNGLGGVLTILPMGELGIPCFAQNLASFTVRSLDPTSSTSRSLETE